MPYSILIILAAQLSISLSLTAQPFLYRMELADDYSLSRIIAITDPYTQTGDTISVVNNEYDPTKMLLKNIPILIKRKSITVHHKLTCEPVFQIQAEHICEVYSSAFTTIEAIKTFLQDEIGDKKGNYFKVSSKKKIRTANSFLQKPNTEIIYTFASAGDPLSPIETEIVNEWLWTTKLSLYLRNRPDLLDILPAYSKEVDPEADLRICTSLLPMMRFVQYITLLTSDDSSINLSTYVSAIHQDSSFFSLFNYAALLYCIKSYYPHFLQQTNESINLHSSFPDTTILSTHDLPPLNFLLSLYRNKMISLNMNYKATDLSLESLAISDTLASQTIIIDFWGTWCKPCRDNMPAYDALAKKYEGHCQFISIAYDQQDKWLKFMKTHNNPGITHLLAQDELRHFFPPGIHIYPTYLITDEKGNILKYPTNSIHDVAESMHTLFPQVKD